VRRDGGPWFLWPDSTLDSLVFDLKLRVPLVDHEGPAVFVVPVRNGVPVFTVLRPWGESAHVIRPPHVWYPQGLDRSGVEGSLVVQFVVDTNGRADPATVRDLWPSDRPRLTGELGAYYDRFLGTVKSALEDARFQPANVGGCPIRQIVKMPFTFHVRR
jgi:hypothetical protein